MLRKHITAFPVSHSLSGEGLKEVKRIEVILIKGVPLTNLFLRRYI
jgi:hypothetical protein